MSNGVRHDMTWGDLIRRPGDARPPAAVVVGVAMTLQLLWVGLGRDLLSSSALTAGVVVSAAVASVWLTVPAAAGEAVLAFLVADGFIQGAYGSLTWAGVSDAGLLVGTVLLCVVVAEATYDVGRARHLVSSAEDRRSQSRSRGTTTTH